MCCEAADASLPARTITDGVYDQGFVNLKQTSSMIQGSFTSLACAISASRSATC